MKKVKLAISFFILMIIGMTISYADTSINTRYNRLSKALEISEANFKFYNVKINSVINHNLSNKEFYNIFIEIMGKNNFFLKLPLTVVIVLLIFGFWILIPLVVIGLFLDIKFSVESKKVNTDKTNDILSKISKEVQNIKSKIKSGGK